MSEFGKLLGLCTNCLRYNPGAVSNCLLARDAGRLAKKWKYNLMVTDCGLFHPPTIPEEEVVEEEVDFDEDANDGGIK